MLATVAQSTTAGAFPVRIWHWGSRGFAQPAHDRRARARLQRLGGPGPADRPPSPSTSTSRGRLHAAWPLTQPVVRRPAVHRLPAHRSQRLRAADRLSRRPGRPADTVERFAVAANSGGSGWLVWDDLSDRVRAVPLVTPPRGSRVGSRRIGRRRVTRPGLLRLRAVGRRLRAPPEGRRAPGGPDPLRALLLRRRPARRAPTAAPPYRLQLHAALRAGQPARRRRPSCATACPARARCERPAWDGPS